MKLDGDVLDIGCGLGFLKPLVLKSASYTGIEADFKCLSRAKTLYGEDNFICGYFPGGLSRQFNTIISLSCVDEVPDKKLFFEGIHNLLLDPNSYAFVAVRNKSFIINIFKSKKIMKKMSHRSKICLNDLEIDEWKNLINMTGFQIIKSGKFYRPWITGFSLAGIKNIFYKIITFIMPTRYSYMIFFTIIKK